MNSLDWFMCQWLLKHSKQCLKRWLQNYAMQRCSAFIRRLVGFRHLLLVGTSSQLCKINKSLLPFLFFVNESVDDDSSCIDFLCGNPKQSKMFDHTAVAWQQQYGQNWGVLWSWSLWHNSPPPWSRPKPETKTNNTKQLNAAIAHWYLLWETDRHVLLGTAQWK